MMDESEWTFISKDLPSFSSPKETFFVFNPEAQKVGSGGKIVLKAS